MYTGIYENSYVVAFVTFVLLIIIFYIFKIGYSTKIENGKIIKKFNWKYPLAISLIVWIMWHFLLFPANRKKTKTRSHFIHENSTTPSPDKIMEKTNILLEQRINMANWN